MRFQTSICNINSEKYKRYACGPRIVLFGCFSYSQLSAQVCEYSSSVPHFAGTFKDIDVRFDKNLCCLRKCYCYLNYRGRRREFQALTAWQSPRVIFRKIKVKPRFCQSYLQRRPCNHDLQPIYEFSDANISSFNYLVLKFVFSKKATKNYKIFTVSLTFT